MNTIGDMQNEMGYLNHYNEFEYNHDFLKVFMKNCLGKGDAPNLR